MKILVIDIGGTHVKCVATDHDIPVRFISGAQLTPDQMMKTVMPLIAHWEFDAVSIGYPGVVKNNRIAKEPYNLGRGWADFDFESAFRRPVKLINDAAMQALGCYAGGRMLFLGLGTGLGSALIVDSEIVAMELGHLRYTNEGTYEDYLGEHGRKRLGNLQWSAMVKDVVEGFRKVFFPDDFVVGGGNVAHLEQLPPDVRRGDNAYAFLGGFRLWENESPELFLGK